MRDELSVAGVTTVSMPMMTLTKSGACVRMCFMSSVSLEPEFG